MTGQDCVRCCAVIGKNFGDEGKGLAVDYLVRGNSSFSEKKLVIRHNGGAQAGHTVERPDGRRFVFHQLGSGTMAGADTFWTNRYFPDLFKLSGEIGECGNVAPVSKLFADADTPVTLIDDVILNMSAELVRGENRHGSCGMGIYEAYLRTKAGFGITVGELEQMTENELIRRIREIRRTYFHVRRQALGIPECLPGECGELFADPNVLNNYADQVLENLNRYVVAVGESERKSFFEDYGRIVFETGQGLLLDANETGFGPHVSASRTGLFQSMEAAKRYGLNLAEAVYVSRSYVTRHGAGPLPEACEPSELGDIEKDLTNVPNPWQGSMRYAKHGTVQTFTEPVQRDIAEVKNEFGHAPEHVTLLLTHLNETGGNVIFREESLTPGQLGERMRDTFDRVLCSASRYSEEINEVIDEKN